MKALRLAALVALSVSALACSPSTRPAPKAPAPSAALASLSDAPLPHAPAFPSARALATAPAGRTWSNVAIPADPAWMLLLHPDAREAWSAYVALPPAQRDLHAFTATLERTEPTCKTPTQCTAEARVRTGYALQGWYEGASLVEWHGELWASARKPNDTCAARVAELRRDTTLATVICGAQCGPAIEPGAAEPANVSWHRFERSN